jgi:hypothetical protein
MVTFSLPQNSHGSCKAQVQSDQGRDELGRYTLEIDAEFAHGNVSTQVSLVNTAKRTQEITGRSPQALHRVGMNFADAVAVIISRPFSLTMTDRGMGSDDMVVATPLVREDLGTDSGRLVNVLAQGFLVGMMNDPQSNLAGFSANRAHNRRAIVLVRPMSTLVVGSASGWVAWIAMGVTFFPPRSETSHRFQSGRRIRLWSVAVARHWLGAFGVDPRRSGDTLSALAPGWRSVHLCSPPHEPDDLRRTKVTPFKHGPAIQGVDAVA